MMTNKPDRKGWTEKEHIKQSEPQKIGGRPAGELEKAVVFFLVRVYESVWTGGRRVREADAETTWEARSINTGHANAAPRPLLRGCQSNIRTTLHTKS